MIEVLFSAIVPLALTGFFMLVAILIDMMCSQPYHLLGIQLEYPSAPLAEKIGHLCIVLAAISSCFVLGLFRQSLGNYFVAFGCWILSMLVMYVGLKLVATSLVVIFRWQDFVNGKA